MDPEAERRKQRIHALLLAVGMLITGTMNTLFLKYQGLRTYYCPPDADECQVCDASWDLECYEQHCSGAEMPEDCHYFEQPVYQTFIMFAGETLCFMAFYIILFFRMRAAAKQGEKLIDNSTLVGKHKFLLWLPTLCDLSATTLMNYGLMMVYTSVYQMLRGAVIVFTGIMSVIFLKRKQYAFHWLGIFIVILGIVLVGLTSTLCLGGSDCAQNSGKSASDMALGIALIIVAQVFTATQFVLEEKILGRYDAPPMLAIGLEGVFGVITLAVLMPILQATAGASDDFGMFDVAFAFKLFLESPPITVSSIGCICSIAFFNFFGLSITKVMSATSRSTIDAMRTMLVWVFSLSFGWESFLWPQVIGFAILVSGTFLYNEVIRLPFKGLYPAASQVDAEVPGETKPLLNNSRINEEY